MSRCIVLAVALLAPLLVHCAGSEHGGLSSGPDNPWLRAKPKSNDRYFLVKGKKGGATYGTLPLDLWAPFDFGVTFQVADDAGGAFPLPNGCIEVDSVDFTTFFSQCAQYDPATGDMTLISGGDPPPPNAQLIPNTTSVDLRLEATGTDLNFYGRATGSDTWMLVNSVPFVQTQALKPGGSAIVAKGAVLIFDDGFFTTAGPKNASPEQNVALLVEQGGSSALQGYYYLDGDAPDFDAAAPQLTSARASFADASSAAAALTSKSGKKAAKQIGAALKKLDQAIDLVADANASKAKAALESAAKKALPALKVLVPQLEE